MREPVTGLILAGGQGSRMGGRDKGLVDYQGEPLVDHVIARIAPQVDELLISANRNLDIYASRGYPVLQDHLPDYPGPLAGVLEGLKSARHEWLLAVPCDMPSLPVDLVARLMAGRKDLLVMVAEDDVRFHPAVMLIHRDLAAELAAYLQSGQRAVHRFQARVGVAVVRFNTAEMQNINHLIS
jgi:molybdopterin-guanine dinucleotide biosynthesis protein A